MKYLIVRVGDDDLRRICELLATALSGNLPIEIAENIKEGRSYHSDLLKVWKKYRPTLAAEGNNASRSKADKKETKQLLEILDWNAATLECLWQQYEWGYTSEAPLVLDLTPEQEKRLELVATLLGTKAEDLAIAEIFAELDTWTDWGEYAEWIGPQLEQYVDQRRALRKGARKDMRLEATAPLVAWRTAGLYRKETLNA